MINLENKIEQQVLKIVNKKTNEVSYFLMDEDGVWKEITESQYEKIRGHTNER